MNTRDIKISFKVENGKNDPVSIPGYVEIINEIESADGSISYKVLCEEIMAEELEAWVRRTDRVKFL